MGEWVYGSAILNAYRIEAAKAGEKITSKNSLKTDGKDVLFVSVVWSKAR
jgi:hypothetical protein